MSNKEGKNETNYSKEKVNFDPETKNTFFSAKFQEIIHSEKALTQSDTKLPNIYQNVEFKENEKDISFEMTIHRTAFEAFLFALPIDGV